MYIKLKNLNIHYKLKGDGDPIVLLHGWGCDLNIFSDLQEKLSKKFKVYAVDLPGFGLSSVPGEVWGSREYSNLMRRFINELKIINPVLLGHSFGAKIVIRLVADNLVSAKKIVLIGSPGIQLPKPFNIKLKICFFKFVKFIVNLPGIKSVFGRKFELYRKKFGSNDYKNSSGIMRKILVKSIGENVASLLPNIKTPALLVWGDKDDSTPLEAGEVMSRSIAGSKFVVFPNAGHFSFLDDSKSFFEELNNFLG